VSTLGFDLYSFSDVRRTGALRAVGLAFDEADPRLRPERIDERDPIRTKIASAADYLGAVESVPEKTRTSLLYERRRQPRLGGGISFERVAPESLKDPHRIYFSADDADWFGERDRSDALADLFVRLAGGFDAYMGFATDHRMPWQQRVEFILAQRRGEPAPGIPGPFSDRHSLRDVYWLNFFGPSYVERFGPRLDGLGVRQERTSNGGLVVWAAETPFLYRDDVASFMDYSWKQPFYEALGRDTFVHVGQAPGQHVPTREDHVRSARRLEVT